MTSLMETNLEKKIKNESLINLQNKFMKILLPFVPHIACECLSKLEGKDFYEEIQWPKADRSLLGKTRSYISCSNKWEEKGLNCY